MNRWYVLAGGGLAMFAALIAVPLPLRDANDPSPRATFVSARRLSGEVQDGNWLRTTPVVAGSNFDLASGREISPERLQVIKELQDLQGDYLPLQPPAAERFNPEPALRDAAADAGNRGASLPRNETQESIADSYRATLRETQIVQPYGFNRP